MTRPFFFADLSLNAAILTPGVSSEPCKPVADKGCDSKFPHLTFDRSQSKKTGKAERRYTAEDLTAALDEVRQATAFNVEAQTRAALSAEIDHRQVQALEAIRDQLCTSEEVLGRWMANVTVTVERLALMIGQAIVPRALEQQPLADIGDMVRQSLSRLIDQPSIELRLEADLVEQAADLVKKVSREAGYQGQLVAIADPTMDPGGAQLTWKNGIADRDLKRIQNEVELLVNAWFHDMPKQTPMAQSDVASAPVAERDDTTKRNFSTEPQTSEERSLS